MNGALNTNDLLTVMKHIIGSSKLTGDALKAADMNGDGAISIIDLIKLKNKLI